MAATVTIQEANGSTPAYTAVTSIRFCNADNPNPGIDYPMVVPQSGNSYSFWKTLLLDLAGDFTRINNIRFYSQGDIDWPMGTGGEARIGARDTGDWGILIDSEYAQASGTGTSGNAIEDPTNGHPAYIADGAAWAASTDYSEGDVVHPTTLNGFVYECTAAGTSDSSEPAWPTTPGDTVTDGGATWECKAVTANLNNYTNDNPIIIDSANHDAAGKSKAAVLQVKLATDADHGVFASKTFWWAWDEI